MEKMITRNKQASKQSDQPITNFNFPHLNYIITMDIVICVWVNLNVLVKWVVPKMFTYLNALKTMQVLKVQQGSNYDKIGVYNPDFPIKPTFCNKSWQEF